MGCASEGAKIGADSTVPRAARDVFTRPVVADADMAWRRRRDLDQVSPAGMAWSWRQSRM